MYQVYLDSITGPRFLHNSSRVYVFSFFLSTCLCLQPENRPSVFAFFCVWANSGWGGWGGVINVLGLCPSRPAFCSSVLRCAYVRVRWICLLYFVAHMSGYVGYVFCTLLQILHVTLEASSVLPCTSFPATKPKGACPHWDNRLLLEGM